MYGAPCTMAKGISVCSGAGSAPMILVSSFCMGSSISALAQAHGLAYFVHRVPRHRARGLAALGHRRAHRLGVGLDLLGALAYRRQLLQHRVDHRLLAVQAADAG